MLVLSRKNQERVILTDTETGETITVVVTGLQHGRVRLGFVAGERWKILREEVLAKIGKER